MSDLESFTALALALRARNCSEVDVYCDSRAVRDKIKASRLLVKAVFGSETTTYLLRDVRSTRTMAMAVRTSPTIATARLALRITPLACPTAQDIPRSVKALSGEIRLGAPRSAQLAASDS